MKFKTFLSLTALTALGTMAYAVNYLAKNEEFSEDTIEKYNHLIKNMKALGADVKRTYTSIGDKASFKSSTTSLSKNAKKMSDNGISLVKTASSDMYNVFKEKFIDDEVDSVKKKKINKKSTSKSKTKISKNNKNAKKSKK